MVISLSQIRTIAAAILLGSLLSACGYNTIPTLEEQAKAKWSDVQNNYQRRADLIPNLVATVQGWPSWNLIVMSLAVVMAGQFLEGNLLSPKLVGASVGLHPVWLMFALFAFGALFGFVGLLIAVPAAAAVGVLVRFAIGRYLQSPLYIGHHHPAEASLPAVPPAAPGHDDAR